MRILRLMLVSAVVSVLVTQFTPLFAQLPAPPDAHKVLSDAYTGKSYSPYARRGFPSRAYWGDTHLHTSLSFDASAFGNRLAADAA